LTPPALCSTNAASTAASRTGEKAPIQAGRRWHVERTHAWQNAFDQLARCYERRVTVIDAFFDLGDTVISLLCKKHDVPGSKMKSIAL